MNLLDSDSMKSITENLASAKKVNDEEVNRLNDEEAEKKRILLERQLKENEEIAGIKTFVQDLAEKILGTNQIAEWGNSDEEDYGENYLAIEKDLANNVSIYLWSDGIGINFIPLALGDVKTVALARMIKNKFDWIVADGILPIVKNC